MNIDKKIKIIEDNCIENAENDAKELSEKVQNMSHEKIEEKIENYKKELEVKYNKEINKINREYNKNLFDYEMIQKVKINQFKDTLINNIKTKLETELIAFASSYEYKEYLFDNIRNTLKDAFAEKGKCKLYVVEKDFYKYKDEILQNFNVNIERIDNKYIGGCLIVNDEEKISIDNTIKTNIEEQIKDINL